MRPLTQGVVAGRFAPGNNRQANYPLILFSESMNQYDQVLLAES
jgi:hypothetical protein